MREFLLSGAVAFSCLFCSQALALGSNNATGWIWDEGQGGNLLNTLIDLRQWGITVGGVYTGEAMSNLSGGLNAKTTYDDVVAGEANFELQRIFGWSGALAHISAISTHGLGLSHAALNENLLNVSNIAADGKAHLYEFWLEQLLFGRSVSVRVGKMGADTEFTVSSHASLFLNGSHGWSALMSADLPDGGPSYPLATPAIRAAWLPNPDFSLAVGLYAGAVDHGADNKMEPSKLVIAEATYSRDGTPARDALKFGYWYSHTNTLPPIVDGDERIQQDQSGFYFMVDQSIAQFGQRRVGGFARLFVAGSNHAAIAKFFDAGIELDGVLPGYSEDELGVSIATAVPGAYGIAGSTTSFGKRIGMDVELTYRLPITDNWSVQPDIQYVIHPGNYSDSDAPGYITDALVVGFRTSMEF